ncbi:hypothetical protein AFLA70_638g000611 [Aspergillus flavus AF70]|nr:hypothetical protein AFLA70_638g000611 [Aspergillus flavus AF70]
MNVFVTLLLVALMGCPLVKAMPINGGMAHQFQPSLSAHAGSAVGLSMGIPLLAGMANDIWLYNKIMNFDLTPATETSAAEAPKEAPAENTQATPAAAAEKENEAPAEQPKEEAGMYTIPE